MIELETARLALRPVAAGDLALALALGADARVMASLGGTQSAEQCQAWLARQLEHWRTHAFGRFHVSANNRFVGFVGLSRHDFERGIVPGVEVAWRLAFDEWGKGYATEAARAAIAHGFQTLGLTEIIAVTNRDNARSRRVMERLGMHFVPEQTFEHPLLPAGDPLRSHVVYRLSAR
jgi:RimJ/RimL family protein N-acetyltransferase